MLHLASNKLFFFSIDVNYPIVKVALENLKAAGVDNQVTIVIGPAAESLTKFSPEEPFDLVFIDADKASNSIYFSEAKRLLRKGGVIVGLAFTYLLYFFADSLL